VKGAQGADYGASDKVVSSVKHYVAYGQPEGGRDYNTTDMSEQRLRNLYLPPFKAAIDAGAGTVMCSFNAINGVPGCANRHTETDILKNEWGFDGFIESDYTAVAETRACPPVTPNEGPCGHGTAADGPSAAANALMAGTDSEMVSTNIRDYGQQLLSQGRISQARLDDAVRRILRVKFRAGLFDHPYVDQARATDPASFLTASDRAAARNAAGKSMVLLKNSGQTLPQSPRRSSVRLATTSTTCLARGGAWAVTKTRSACSPASGRQAPGPSPSPRPATSNITSTRRTTPTHHCPRTTRSAASPHRTVPRSLTLRLPHRTPTRSCSPWARTGR
jgi:beta-glucosidase